MSVQGAIIYLVCRYAYVCVRVCDIEFVVFTDCESCTRPIATNPGFMEVGQYRLTRVTYFLACRRKLDAVAGLLWIRGVFWVGGRTFPCFFFFGFSFSSNADGLLQA